MLHWIGNNCPMWIDWTLNTHLMCSYLLAIFTGKCYVRKFSSSSHLKKKVNFCIYMTRIWNPLPSPYTLVFDLLVRVANVFLELFPLKAEHYDYYNLIFCNDHKPGGKTSQSPSWCGRGPTWWPGTCLWKYFRDIFTIFLENDSQYFRIVTFSEYFRKNLFTVQVCPCFHRSLLLVISSRSRAFIVFYCFLGKALK